jgi:hypothetical protein
MYGLSVKKVKNSARTPARRPTWIQVVLCTGLMSIPIFYLTEFLNPDWFGYQLIYENEGAWLSAQGRDPLFLLLIQIANVIFGANHYDQFREWLGWLFIGVSAWLARGAGWKPRDVTSSAWGLSLTLAILQFGLTRFTVQIREGIAIVVVLIALRWATKDGRAVLVTAFLCGAALVHGGASLLLLGWLIALGWAYKGKSAARPKPSHAPYAILLGLLVGLVAFNRLDINDAVNSLFNREENATTHSSLKIIYQMLLGACMVVAAQAASRAYPEDNKPIARAIGWWGWVLAPGIYGLLIAQFVTDQPLVIVASTLRALAMLTSLQLLLAALRARQKWPVMLTCIFLLVDQTRGIAESLVATYGGVGF